MGKSPLYYTTSSPQLISSTRKVPSEYLSIYQSYPLCLSVILNEFYSRDIHGVSRLRVLKPRETHPFNSGIHLLLVHALRHGFIVKANTLEEALEQANVRGDRTIQWSKPSAPLIAARVAGDNDYKFGRLDFSRPASSNSIPNILQKMNRTSGIAARFTSHNIRAGGLRDVAHIPPSQIMGTTNAGVAKAAGHTSVKMYQGVTDGYIGPLNQDINVLKADNPYVDNAAPMTNAPVYPKLPISSDAITAALPTELQKDKKARVNMAARLKKEQEQRRIADAKAGNMTTAAAAYFPTLDGLISSIRYLEDICHMQNDCDSLAPTH